MHSGCLVDAGVVVSTPRCFRSIRMDDDPHEFCHDLSMVILVSRGTIKG